jgi:hypothetical protein
VSFPRETGREGPRRPPGGEEGEAACRGRRGGGSASTANGISARLPPRVSVTGQARAETTAIRIRERTFPEILDLAFLVIRRWPLGLAATLAAGAIPFALLDRALGVDGTEWWWQAVVYAAEVPLATAPLVLWLGQATFVDRPSGARLVRDWLRSLVPMVLLQAVLRGVLLVLVVTVPYVYALRPYGAEIILLERAGPDTAPRRSAGLHAGSMGLLLGRWIAALLCGLLFGGCLWYALATLRQALGGGLRAPEIDEGALGTIEGQVALWATIGYLAVVRFLSYLDLRIRREGWEVELELRAAAARLPGGSSSADRTIRATSPK